MKRNGRPWSAFGGTAVSVVYALLAGVLWGTIGLFVRALGAQGLSSVDIVVLRAALTSLLLFAYLAFRRIPLFPGVWALPYLLGTGVASMALFNWAYFQAIRLTPLPVAVALLYTAPAFVVLLARVVLGEKIARAKALALVASVFGVLLASGAGFGAFPGFIGTGYGLLAGFAYGLYTIFAKPLAGKVPPEVVAAYTFLFAGLALAPFASPLAEGAAWLRGSVLAVGLTFALFPTALAYTLYTKSLEVLDAGRAAILVTVEPVVATLLGIFVLGDTIRPLQLVGSALVVVGAILVGRES